MKRVTPGMKLSGSASGSETHGRKLFTASGTFVLLVITFFNSGRTHNETSLWNAKYPIKNEPGVIFSLNEKVSAESSRESFTMGRSRESNSLWCLFWFR